MKIAIDCRSLRKKPVGVPNFLIAVINSLAEEQKNWIFYLLSNEDFSQEVKKKLIRQSDFHFKKLCFQHYNIAERKKSNSNSTSYYM